MLSLQKNNPDLTIKTQINSMIVKTIKNIVNELKDGAVIAFPTDTVFGLGCVYDNLDSIQKIKDIKHRDANKPLPMMCSSIEMVKEICVVDEDDIRLMNNIGKGAITYIFKLNIIKYYVIKVKNK